MSKKIDLVLVIKQRGIGFVFGVTIYLEHDFIWLDKLQKFICVIIPNFPHYL